MKLTTIQKGFLSLLFAGFIYGLFGIFTRQLAVMFGDAAQVIARQLIITLLALGILVWQRETITMPHGKRKLLAIFGIISFLNAFTFTTSANLIKVSNTVFFVNSGSLVGSLLIGTLFFKEKLTAFKLTVLGLCLVGILVFTYPIQLDASLLGIVLGLGAGITDAVSNSIKKYLKEIPRTLLLLNQYAIAVVFGLSALPFIQEVHIREIDLASLAALLLFGLALLLVGNATIYGFQNFDLNLGSVVLASELVFSLIISASLLHEYPTINEVVGGIIIFAAIILINIKIDLSRFRLWRT